MMLHLETLDFFDAGLVDERVRYLSGYGALAEKGLPGVLAFLRSELRAKRNAEPGVLVIDGFLALSDSSTSVAELKEFLQSLQLLADLVNVTVLVLAGPTVAETRPEHTMVDGILELTEEVHELQALRELRVRKLRGGPHLRGGHFFTITEAGLHVYPRIEALYRTPSVQDPCDEGRVTSGVPPLDEMLDGGIPCGTTTLALGPSGSGKTTLGLHYIGAAPRGTRSVLFGFYETPARLLEKADRLHLPLRRMVKRGELEIVWQPSTEQHVDALAERLLGAVERSSATRLFVDGLDGFQRSTMHPDRVHHVFTAISNELRVRGVTTLYSFEVPKFLGPEVESPITGVSGLAENLIYLRFVELRSQLYRLLSILKVRDSGYDSSLREFHITDRGIRLEETFASAEQILTGVARTQ